MNSEPRGVLRDITGVCSLCNEEFTSQIYAKTPISRKWEFVFVAVLSLKDEPRFVITRPSIIPLTGHESKGICAQHPNYCSKIEIRRRTRVTYPHAYAFHAYCWKALNPDKNFLPEHVFNLAKSVSQLYKHVSKEDLTTGRYLLGEGLQQLAQDENWGSRVTDIPSGSELTSLLQRVRIKLPSEIIFGILGYLELCPLRSILHVKTLKSQGLLSKVNQDPPRTEPIALNEPLAVHFIQIRERQYICGLENRDTLVGYSGERTLVSHIRIPLDARTIVFRVGTCGIEDIQLEGQGERFVGGQDDNVGMAARPYWTGRVSYTEPITHLYTYWDGLKLRSFSTPSEESDYAGKHQTNHFVDRFMWDHDTITGTALREGFYQAPVFTSRTLAIDGFPGWLLIRYLPLALENYVLYGLTISCTGSGRISGMGAHFTGRYPGDEPKSLWTGCQTGCALHFRMKNGERIVSVGICRHRKMSVAYLLPTVTVRTSEGRSYAFAPCSNLSDYTSPDSTIFHIKPLASQNSGSITGLYYDPLRLVARNISCLGVTCLDAQPPEDDPDLLPPQLFEHPPMEASSRAIFRSEARLLNICTIRACFSSGSNRFTGMIILYRDDSEVVLGQWHEHRGYQHALLYDSECEGELGKLRFTFSDGDSAAIVCGISSIGIRSHASCTNSTVFKDIPYGDTLIWWFSEHSDVIRSEP